MLCCIYFFHAKINNGPVPPWFSTDRDSFRRRPWARESHPWSDLCDTDQGALGHLMALTGREQLKL